MNPAPIRALITGSDGLIGWHTRCHLFGAPGINVSSCTRQQFADRHVLRTRVENCHVVLHLAAVNRGSDHELEFTNPQIAQMLIEALEETDNQPNLIYANSIHYERDTPYGRGKRAAHELFRTWADRRQARYCNLVLPHVFGEHGRPFHNSVVSTFAWQLANDQQPTVHADNMLNLLHASDVAIRLREAVLQPLSGTVRLEGSPVTVQQLLARLTTLVERYRVGVMPALSNPFDIKLFNTYRSYLPRESRLIGLNLIKDQRGQLFETIRCDGQGQVFVSTTEPGVTRGNHFHTRKVERFVVCDGNAAVRLRRMLTGEVAEYLVGGEDPVAIDIPTLHTHSITNVGSTPLVTLFWCNEHFSPDDPDTVACEVEVSEVCRP